MRWLVVRFRGRDKTPSIIDWDREQRAHRCDRVTATGDGTEAARTGSRHRRGHRKALQRAGSAGLQDAGQSRASA